MYYVVNEKLFLSATTAFGKIMQRKMQDKEFKPRLFIRNDYSPKSSLHARIPSRISLEELKSCSEYEQIIGRLPRNI